jgi:GntR family transcriptional regulator
MSHSRFAIVMPQQAERQLEAYQPKRRDANIRPPEIAVRGRRLTRAAGPLYKQLLAILRDSIVSGSPPVGTPLPREADLAEGFKVSLITVRQALRDLETEGFIQKRAAKPAIVADPGARLKPAFDFRTFGDIAAFTRNARLKVDSYRKERAEIASVFFGLSSRSSVHVLRGVLVSAGRPEAQITTYFPPSVGQRLSRAAFDDVLIFRSVEKHLGIKMAAAQLTVRAETADSELARKLNYDEGAAVLAMELRFRTSDGEPAELTVARHRSDLFSLSYDVPNDALRRSVKG